MRPSRLLLAFLPVVVACDDENDLGIGLGRGDRFTATLTGANVRPSPAPTAGTATASITVREPDVGMTGRSVAYTITVTGLTSVTAAHIHLGGAAVANGQLLATLFTNPNDSTITATQLVTGSFTAPSGGISLDSLVSLMESGNAYVDLHASSSITPVVRGQIVRNGDDPPLDRFAATSLTGAKERPTPVTTTATGAAEFELASASSVRYEVTVAGITGVRMAHIHTGVADSAGPIAVTLFTAATPTGPLTGVLANGTFSGTSIELPGIDLDSLLTLMRLGRTYVNVHTADNPAGEIRAQIQPVSVLP